MTFSICFQLLEFGALHQEYCFALAVGQDFLQNAAYTAISVRIRALHCTLVDKIVRCREELLASNPTTPESLPKAFAARWQPLRNAPS